MGPWTRYDYRLWAHALAVQPQDMQLVSKDHRQVSYLRACSQSTSGMNEVNGVIIYLLYN